MRSPTVLLQNLETTIQEPLCRNSRVLTAIRRSHERLQRSIAALYPGSLVLTLSADHHPPPAAGEDHRLEQRALHSHQPQGAG